MAPTTQTPLMKQYEEMKKKHPDAILLFRVGDFYETFSNDAVVASEILGITLTRCANGKAKAVELTGFPYHALDTYLPKLVRAGKRVAICEQLEDPKLTKNLVKRGITESAIPTLKPGQTRLPNGLIIGEKVKEKGMSFNNANGRFMIHKGQVGIFIVEPGNNWYFAPLILSPEDEARYRLYTELSWKYSEWIWIEEYSDDNEAIEYFEEYKRMYSDFVSRYGFLNAPENAAFIKLDAYSDNLTILEKEVIDSNGNKSYVPGDGYKEMEEYVQGILEEKNPIDFTPIFSLLTLLCNAMGALYKLSEIRRKTAEIRALSQELRLSPKLAFNACYDEIVKIPQPSLFRNI